MQIQLSVSAAFSFALGSAEVGQQGMSHSSGMSGDCTWKLCCDMTKVPGRVWGLQKSLFVCRLTISCDRKQNNRDLANGKLPAQCFKLVQLLLVQLLYRRAVLGKVTQSRVIKLPPISRNTLTRCMFLALSSCRLKHR